MSAAATGTDWPGELPPGAYEIDGDVVRGAAGEPVADLAATAGGDARERARHTAAFVRDSGRAHRYREQGAGGPVELSFEPGESGRVRLTLGAAGPAVLSPPVLQAAIAATDDLIIITDAAFASDGPRVLFVNQAFVRATGYAPDEVVGLPLRKLTSGVVEPDLGELLARMRRREHTRVEARHKRKDGTPFWIESDIAPVEDETGWPTHWVIVGRDTSARRTREAQRLRAGKHESLGLLARGIAQDFNELLARMVTDCEAIAAQAAASGAPQGGLGDAARSLVRAVDQARALTRQLSALARDHQAVVRRGVDLGALVREAIAAGLAGSPVQATIEAMHPLHVLGDEGQLREAFTNLVANARQAMGERGEIEVSVRPVFVAHEGGLSLRPGAYAEVTVRDAGPGIPSEHLGRVFEPYFTTKLDGNGLGLTVVDSIVHHHGGHVEAHSIAGAGASFCVYLPLAASTGAAGGRALCVDGDPQVRETVQRMLEVQGWTAEGAPDGASALARCQAAVDRGAPFDLVLIDLAPHADDPLTTARALRRRFAAPAIILMSGASLQSGLSEQGLAQAFLEKPFDAEALRAAVRRAAPGRGR